MLYSLVNSISERERPAEDAYMNMRERERERENSALCIMNCRENVRGT